MATRQYIGARYVPKFATPTEWNSALSYEGLTIVTHLGNSFTSKKPVPAGIDISNTDYWANTGNYNAQVEQYRQEVENVKETVNTEINNVSYLYEFANKKMLIIGDSNCESGPDWLGSPRWPDSAKELCPSLTIVNNSKSGRLLTKTDTENVTSVVTEINNLPASIDYDYVVVFAGVNDYLHGITLGYVSQNDDVKTFNGAFNYIFKALKSKCPKAKLVYISPLITYIHTSKEDVKYPLEFYRIASFGCTRELGFENDGINVTYINGNGVPGYYIHGTGETYYSMDGLHYKPNFSEILASYILRKISTGGDTSVLTNRVSAKFGGIESNDYIEQNYSYYEVNPDGSIDIKLYYKVKEANQYKPITTELGEIFANYLQTGGIVVSAGEKASYLPINAGSVLYAGTSDVSQNITGFAKINSKCFCSIADRPW